MKTYRIHRRSGAQRTGHMTYGIGIPREVAELVTDRDFMVELCEDGILLRPVVLPDYRPAWLQSGGTTCEYVPNSTAGDA